MGPGLQTEADKSKPVTHLGKWQMIFDWSQLSVAEPTSFSQIYLTSFLSVLETPAETTQV